MKILMLFILVACSQENFEDGSATSNKTSSFERDYTMKEMTSSCELGCIYHYDIYKSANELVKNAVSLTKPQLEGIQRECKKYCLNTLFVRINQLKNLEEIKQVESKQVEVSSEEKKKEETEIEPKKEEKKVIKEDDELKPFEEL